MVDCTTDLLYGITTCTYGMFTIQSETNTAKNSSVLCSVHVMQVPNIKCRCTLICSRCSIQVTGPHLQLQGITEQKALNSPPMLPRALQ